MKSRPTWFLYLLVLLTGGLFGFVWLAMMIRDVTSVLGDRRGWVVLSNLLLFAVGLHLVLLVLIIGSPLMSAFHRMLVIVDIPLVLLLIVLEIILILTISNKSHRAIGSLPTVWSTTWIILLTFLMFISLIILQLRLNRITVARRMSTVTNG